MPRNRQILLQASDSVATLWKVHSRLRRFPFTALIETIVVLTFRERLLESLEIAKILLRSLRY